MKLKRFAYLNFAIFYKTENVNFYIVANDILIIYSLDTILSIYHPHNRPLIEQNTFM